MFDRDSISVYGLALGLISFIFFITNEPPSDLNYKAWITAGVAILMTIWWVTEAIPIYITGLIPIIVFPLFNIFEIQDISNSYAHPLVLLFLGGFIIASAMESCGLHKIIALNILSLFIVSLLDEGDVVRILFLVAATFTEITTTDNIGNIN